MPVSIHVEPNGPGRYGVTVDDGNGRSTHTVSLSPDYYEKLTHKRVPAEKLIEHSFRFLLEHESKESILRQFDLPLIGHYFPGYETEIRRRLAD